MPFNINDLVKSKARPRKTDNELTVGSAISGKGMQDINDPLGNNPPPPPTPTPTPQPKRKRTGLEGQGPATPTK